VGAGLGIMLFPRIAAHHQRSDIIVRRLPRALPPREIYAAVPSGYRAPGVEEMLACLRKIADSLPADASA
jgi:DNA-binding transcriptional LysR family regulator